MAFLPFPSGTVCSSTKATPPSGWLACDGTAYNQSDYPELYAVLLSTYNTQINPTTGVAWTAPSASQFRVPDYRGTFLRGVGTPSGLDAVTLGGFQSQKTKPNGLAGTAAGQTLGTTNVSGVVSGATTTAAPIHGHPQYVSANDNTGGGAIRQDWDGDFSNLARISQGYIYTGGMNSNASHTHPVSATTDIAHTHPSASSLTITGDNETRPSNAGVLYFIKI